MDPTDAARSLSKELASVRIEDKVAVIYDPTDYAWDVHRAYLERFGAGKSRTSLWVGMNPGPWGMVQTGVPFGDVDVVTGWMGLSGDVGRPEQIHPDRPVHGLSCERNERSGTRLWTFARDEWGSLEAFLADHLVVNHCPLAMFSDDGTNVTPSKLLKADRQRLFEPCDRHLARLVDHYDPDALVGVGKFASERARSVVDAEAFDVEVVRILHPSPASPKANRGWAEQVLPVLEDAGLGP